MAERLDPNVLFELIAAHVPGDLKANVVIVGSLAAAYHFRDQLQHGGVTTKDADAVIQPANAVNECRSIARRLLDDGWRRVRDVCYPRETPEPAEALRAIRLWPPKSEAYFIELLGFPGRNRTATREFVPVQLSDGWYGIPTFRFLALTAFQVQNATVGIKYAAPPMMALANLLSHPSLGSETMSDPIGERVLRRSAKDLGRVLGLAFLAGRDETETWPDVWDAALRTTFLDDCRVLAERAGNGLRQLLDDSLALDEARHALDIGLLAGRGLRTDQLRAVGQQLFADALDPLVAKARVPRPAIELSS